MSLPYTYLIGWSAHNKYYYGVRHAKGCHPNDLWVKYFTSSKLVKNMRLQYGEPDIINIRRTFDNKQKAAIWEEKVLQKMKVIFSDKWLNKACGKTIINDIVWNKGKKFKYTKIECNNCGTFITKQNLTRHLYTCTSGLLGVKNNSSVLRLNRKTFEFKCEYCGIHKIKQDTPANRRKRFCSHKCSALSRPINHFSKSKLKS